ncbi:MAG TPA: hypothetical protein VK530_12755, partial [Candidatus Acidoferrum sp.]|nr:hypothetical protein [Candidatus Acidoferrum sp.]
MAEGASLEKELTTLLRLRLAREPEAFVLDRRDLGTLQNEKDFSAIDERFWNGAYVIDGVINRDVVSLTHLTIDLRVAAPQVAPVEFRVNGQRQAMSEIVDALVTNLLITIGKKRSTPAWQTEAEAEKFLQEAQWAATWGLWPQVRETSDASWYLGNRTQLTAAYRIVARGTLALLMGDHQPNGSALFDKYGFLKTPSPEGLTMMAQTLELFRESTEALGNDTNQIDSSWVGFGLHLLPLTSRVLEPYYRNVSYRSGQQQSLQRLRSLARDLNEWLTTNSVSAEERRTAGLSLKERLAVERRASAAPKRPQLPRVYYRTHHVLPTSLPAAWWESDGLWFDSPQEAVALYEKILTIPEYYAARHTMPTKGQPPLAAWSPGERAEIGVSWSRFLSKMAASTNLLMKADGNVMTMSFSVDPIEIEKAARTLSQITTENPNLIGEAVKSTGIGMMSLSAGDLIASASRRIEKWGVPQAETLRQLARSSSQEAQIFEAAEGYRAWTNILRMVTETNSRMSGFAYPNTPLKFSELATLIHAFEKAEQQYPAQDRTGRKRIAASALSMLRAQQQALGKKEIPGQVPM